MQSVRVTASVRPAALGGRCISRYRCVNACGTGRYKLREMSQVVVLRVVVQTHFLRGNIHLTNHGCVTVIANVVRATFTVEQYVPVGPPRRAALQISQDVVPIPLSLGPRAVCQPLVVAGIVLLSIWGNAESVKVKATVVSMRGSTTRTVSSKQASEGSRIVSG